MTTDNPEQDSICLKLINTKCYYEILNIEKTASQEEIRKAYKKVSYILSY